MNIHSDFELPTVQSPKQFCFSFAEVPRGRNHLYFHLREFRGAETICILVCGSSASLKPFVFLFAEVPRGRNHLYFRLREFRGAETICILVCGSSASLYSSKSISWSSLSTKSRNTSSSTSPISNSFSASFFISAIHARRASM